MNTRNLFLLQEIEKFGKTPSNRTLNDKTFDREGYTVSIQRAVRDLTARTLNPRKSTPEQPISGTLIDLLLDKEKEDSFLNQISKFFHREPMDQTAFDHWHHQRCLEVLTAIQTYYTNKDGSQVCYGKAQKIVNMTLKGCYCLDGASAREAYFQHCHMALDSFTLAWYNRSVASKKDSIHTAWSNLSETEYHKARDAIRTIRMDIEPLQDLTPLQTEFLIWPLEIMINTVKEVNKCFGGLVDGGYAATYFEKYGLKNDLIMANIILDRASPDRLDDSFVFWLQNRIPKNQTGKQAAAAFILEKYGIE